MPATSTHTIGPLKTWLHEAATPARGRVILVHGLGEHSGRHAGTAGELRRRGFEVIHFDQRGCGQSEGRPQWIERFEDYADDLRSVLGWAQRSRQALPTFLLGHSLGGAVVIHAVASVPQGSLRGIVLTAPAYLPGTGVSAVKIFAAKLLERVLPGLRVPGTLEVEAISRDPQVVDAYRKDPHTCTFNTVRQGNEILRALERLPALCEKVTVPALVAHGDADRLVKVEGSHTILASLASPDKTLKLFPGAYHELHNDLVRAEFYACLADWIERRL